MTKRQRGLFTISLVILTVFAALCVANRPRFWWQERFCGAALYWLPFVLFTGVWALSRVARKGSWLLLVPLLCSCYTLAVLAHKAWPFVFFNNWPLADATGGRLLSGVWLDSWGDSDRSEPVFALIRQRNPDLVLISGYGTDRLAERLAAIGLNNRITTGTPLDGEIQLVTRLEAAHDRFQDLGLDSLPGGTISLRLKDQTTLLLGTMVLARSRSEVSFERNRITSRRLSSIMRNSSMSRIVAANFATTPFSQLAAIYPEQTRMRSLMFGAGLLKTTDHRSWLRNFTHSNVFISKDLTRLEFERIVLPERANALFYFSVARARQVVAEGGRKE